MPVFRTPTIRESWVPQDSIENVRFWSRVPQPARGVTVLKKDGVYRQVRDPDHDEVAASDVYYRGGISYQVSDEEAAELTAAGYGEFLE